MTNQKRATSMRRPTTKFRNKGLLRVSTLITALICLPERSKAALVTTCAAGEYLILDTTNIDNMQGVCATCPRGKCINKNLKLHLRNGYGCDLARLG